MIKIGINGLGRIGRAIFRHSLKNKDFQICVINDLNPDINNIAYTLNYDTIYGSLNNPVSVSNEKIFLANDEEVKVFNKTSIDEVPWKDFNVDYIIDATGVLKNVENASRLIDESHVKKIFITHAPDQFVDFTMVLGCNEQNIDVEEHNIIASSICDATAIAPVMEILDKEIGISGGQITTLHPWLSYQNLMDGSSSSWSVPGEIYHHYALGRSVIGNLIPKPTSAVSATTKVLSRIQESDIGSFSYRTPTAIVGSADMTLKLLKKVTVEDVHDILKNYQSIQKWDIIKLMDEPLVSLDFVNSNFSAVVDTRWTSIHGENLLKLVLWYDNEAGYSLRVLDQIKYVDSLVLNKNI
jgi:glyceraldehyde 3-phosphate dehydrogenase